MHKEHLLEHCVRIYGEAAGPLIHRAMDNISEKDFCVATGFRAPEISISRSCFTQGRVFRLTGYNNSFLIMPDSSEREISTLKYADIMPYLPIKPTRSGHQHCFVDNPLNDMFDFESL